MENLKRVIINTIDNIFSFFYFKECKVDVDNKKDVLILPPAEFGSLGDEAMIMSVIDYLQQNYNLVSDLISFKQKSWTVRLKENLGFNTEIVVNSKFGNPFNTIKLLKTAKQYNYFIIIGADILDGHYSSTQSSKRFLLGRILANAGVNVVITGASFNNNINPFVIRELRRVPVKNFVLNIRDIGSFERVKKIYKDAVLTMDVAYLLNPLEPQNYADFLSFKQKGDYIALNINPIHYKKYGEKLIDYFLEYSNYIISETPYNIVLVPHDIRDNTFGKYSDYSLLDYIEKKIDSPSRVFFYKEIESINARFLKYVAYHAKLVITGRMHFAIASLSNAVPVLVMTYQGKFEGMLREIYDTPRKYILNKVPNDTNEIILRTNSILENLEKENSLINSSKIKNKAQINFTVFKSND